MKHTVYPGMLCTFWKRKPEEPFLIVRICPATAPGSEQRGQYQVFGKRVVPTALGDERCNLHTASRPPHGRSAADSDHAAAFAEGTLR